MMTKHLFYFIIFFAFSCNTNVEENDPYLNLSLLNTKSNIQIKKIEIDTIFADFSFTYSGDIFWKLRDDSLYLFDRSMGTVDIYNKQGVFNRRALGVGRGPAEVMDEIRTVCPFNEGWLLVDNYYVYSFSREFNNKKLKYLFAMEDIETDKLESLRKTPNPSKDIELYVPTDFERPQMTLLGDSEFLIKVCCDNPDYKEKRYYQESAIVAKYDFSKGSINKLMGMYSPAYRGDSYTVSFPSHYYSNYKNGQYLLNFEIDSLIYVCDENFNPENVFGLSGKMININYKLTNLEIVSDFNYWREERTQGYYMTVYYCPENDITLRSYKTGIKEKSKSKNERNPTRMQIYKGMVLIGDAPVPDNFEIIGYEPPYFYADGYFETGIERDKVGIYKFKLDLQ